MLIARNVVANKETMIRRKSSIFYSSFSKKEGASEATSGGVVCHYITGMHTPAPLCFLSMVLYSSVLHTVFSFCMTIQYSHTENWPLHSTHGTRSIGQSHKSYYHI
jgi:hypothetical protein